MADAKSTPGRWYSAADLAGLPGMPGTPRSVRRRADTEGWPSVEMPGLGGLRRVYALEILPEETRAALGSAANDNQAPASIATQAGTVQGAKKRLQEDMTSRSRQTRRQVALRQSTQIPAQRQTVMDAKLALLRQFQVWMAERELSVEHARSTFATAYNAHEVDVDLQVRHLVGSVSARTLARWAADLRTDGITALAGRYGNRAGTGKLDGDPELRDFATAMLVQFPHCNAIHVQRALEARFGSQSARVPCSRTLQRWIGDWRKDNAQTALALANPDAWKNQFMTAFGSRSEGIERVNQLWELDSTPGDVMLQDGRHSVIGMIDVFSRRLKLLVSKTSRAVAVAALIRRGLLDFGVPEAAKTDNGSDYVSAHITRVFTSLDVDHRLCAPFSPWQKPHIERGLGTFSHALVELLPGFIGHNVAERSAIEARTSFADRLMTRGAVVDIAMTSEDFQSFCNRWTDDLYQHTPHSGLDHKTPFAVACTARDTLRRIDDERSLDVLLAAAPGGDGWRVVGKKGIQLEGGFYIAPHLEAWIGQRVRVLYDEVEHDLGRVFVFGGDDLHFICVAECPERTGVDRREVANKAREIQKARVQEERRALRATAKRVGVDDVVNEILVAKAEAAGKLAALPVQSQAHASAGLDAAAAAARAATAGPGTSADVLSIDGVSAQWARVRAEAEADAAGVPVGNDNELARRRAANGGLETPTFESAQQRVQWLLQQLHTRALTGEERGYLATYKADHLASYRRMESLAAELRDATDDTSSTRTGTAPEAD